MDQATDWSKADFGTGRIGEIIDGIESLTGSMVAELDHIELLSGLCYSMRITAADLDEIIALNSPVSRTVKGHSFETFFDELLAHSGVESETRGGDTEVDRVVNGLELQLKTPTMAGTKGSVVQYKTHKTHGAKSELESMDYYSKVQHFPDFLVGLVSYEPLRILYLTKDELPRHPGSAGYILSPFSLDWFSHPALNAYQRLGISELDLEMMRSGRENEALPLSSELIGVSSEIIVRTILSRSNFRIWDMSIRGFVREYVLRKELIEDDLSPLDPTASARPRAEKADFALRIGGNYRLFQMKGVSTNNCNFDNTPPEIATETQLTRGRVNDHPTQSRLYLETDFDYLVLALDPPMVKKCREKIGLNETNAWEFFALPTSVLERHSDMPHRLKSLQKFSYPELRTFLVDDWDALA